MQTHSMRLKRFGLVLATIVLAIGMCVVLLAATSAMVSSVRAANPGPHEWVIATGYTGTISIIDAAADIVYGPFLSGTLGSEWGGLFDVAVTPDGKTALISNFGDSAVFFVDVSDPLNPSVILSVTTPMFAEDIAISHDGQFALVADGGFSNVLAVIDLPSRTLAYTITLPSGLYANGVDIAPDGTVIVVDYFQNWVETLYPDASGYLTVTGAYSYVMTTSGHVFSYGKMDISQLASAADRFPQAANEMNATGEERFEPNAVELRWPHPVNLVIAPDGQTILLCDVAPYTETKTVYGEWFAQYSLGVFRITSPGVITFTDVITGLPRATQSIVFSPDGTKAFLSENGGYAYDGRYMHYNHLTVLNIDGPGLVSVNRINAVEFPRLTGSQLFGVDTIAMSTGKLYVGYPTVSGAKNDLRVVNIADYSVKRLDMPGITTCVGVIPMKRVYLPIIVASSP